jgi:hypothetical protein
LSTIPAFSLTRRAGVPAEISNKSQNVKLEPVSLVINVIVSLLMLIRSPGKPRSIVEDNIKIYLESGLIPGKGREFSSPQLPDRA